MYWFYSDLSIFLHRILLSFAPLVICIIWDVIRIVQQLKFITTDLKNEESLRHNISHISDDWTFNRYGYRRNQQQEIIPMQHLNKNQYVLMKTRNSVIHVVGYFGRPWRMKNWMNFVLNHLMYLISKQNFELPIGRVPW